MYVFTIQYYNYIVYIRLTFCVRSAYVKYTKYDKDELLVYFSLNGYISHNKPTYSLDVHWENVYQYVNVNKSYLLI